MNELEEFPHLVPGERFPSHTVVDHHTGQFKAEGILVQDIIIYRQLESRPQHTSDSFYTTVPLPFTLEFDQEQFCIGCLHIPDLLSAKILLCQEVLHELIIYQRV